MTIFPDEYLLLHGSMGISTKHGSERVSLGLDPLIALGTVVLLFPIRGIGGSPISLLFS